MYYVLSVDGIITVQKLPSSRQSRQEDLICGIIIEFAFFAVCFFVVGGGGILIIVVYIPCVIHYSVYFKAI